MQIEPDGETGNFLAHYNLVSYRVRKNDDGDWDVYNSQHERIDTVLTIPDGVDVVLGIRIGLGQFLIGERTGYKRGWSARENEILRSLGVLDAIDQYFRQVLKVVQQSSDDTSEGENAP